MKAQTQAEWLILLRKRLGSISQQELATKVGVVRMTVHRWENQKPNSIPTLEQAARLAKLARTTVDEVAQVFSLGPQKA